MPNDWITIEKTKSFKEKQVLNAFNHLTPIAIKHITIFQKPNHTMQKVKDKSRRYTKFIVVPPFVLALGYIHSW